MKKAHEKNGIRGKLNQCVQGTNSKTPVLNRPRQAPQSNNHDQIAWKRDQSKEQ